MKNTGIVSEIRTARLMSSDNEYLTYPCNVIVHIWERGVDGSIISCTVFCGGSFVRVMQPVFEDMSEELPLRYQHFNPSDEYKKLFP